MHTRILLLPCVMWVVLLLAGCPHDVDLTITNPTAKTLDAAVQVTDPHGIVSSDIGIGAVQPNGQVTRTFQVDDGGSYMVRASLNGPTVFKSSPRTILKSDPKRITATAQLGIQPPDVDPTDTHEINNAFSKLGKNVGFNPQSVTNVNDAILGGLVIYTLPDNGDASFEKFVDPGVLSPTAPWNQNDYPGTSSKRTVVVSTDASAKVSASVPLYGTLAASFKANSVYQVSWDMEGFGAYTKKDDPQHVDFVTAMNSLSGPLKSDICSRLSVPNSKLMYVNTMYVVKRIEFITTEGDQVSTAVDATVAGNVVAGSVVYSFSSSKTQNQKVEDQVENVGGPTWTKDTAPICTPTPAPGPHLGIMVEGLVARPMNYIPEALPGLVANKVMEAHRRQ